MRPFQPTVVRGFSKYTHHHQQVVLQAVGLGLQAAGVFHRRVVVVDRAGPDHHQQAVVCAEEDAVDRAARRKVVSAAFLVAGNSLSTWLGGLSSLISLIRTSSMVTFEAVCMANPVGNFLVSRGF
jgi:hypothetical protein